MPLAPRPAGCKVWADAHQAGYGPVSAESDVGRDLPSFAIFRSMPYLIPSYDPGFVAASLLMASFAA